MKSDQQLGTQLVMILDNLEEGIIAFDDGEQLVFYNGTAATILGLRLGKRREYRAAGLFRAKNPEFYGILGEAIRGGLTGDFIEVIYRKGKRELKLRARPYRAGGGLLFLIIQDVTELWWLHRKERSLVRRLHLHYENLIESLRQIADSVAHEVRNPIVSIGGYANLLLRKCADREHDAAEIRKYLGYIRDDAERLNTIVSGVERYSDLSDVRFAREDIIPLLKEQFTRARVLAEKKSLAMRGGELREAEYLAWMDREKLGNALGDIVGQSIAASRARSRFLIDASFTPFVLSLRVEFDTGSLKDEGMHFIFDPFYNGPGGINLAAAQRIIILHGGIIRVAKREPRGLVLRVTIPRERRLERV
jgi:signal transduction histidine kinase